jgi:radical SAM superfamily enzyme YgiQ (UPF0313 family)
MLEYEGTVIRPPSEAQSVIIQATLGCSDNGCTFCPAFKEKKFSIKNIGQIEQDIKAAARLYPGARRLFFADGDALIMPQHQLVRALELANSYFPRLTRVGIYGSIKSVERKTVHELQKLKNLKLGIVYLGFETGSDEVYERINKYGSPQGNVDACKKVKEAGIRTNVTVILGLGGKELSRQHAEYTAKILNLAGPDQIAALTLMIAPNTQLFEQRKLGEFAELDEFGILEELRLLILEMNDFRCQFFANHASNYYPIAARFPEDKQATLNVLADLIAQNNIANLRPDSLRGL